MDIPKIEGLSRRKIVTLSRARNYKQYLSMLEAYKAGKCAFCDPLLGKQNVVLREIDGWRIWENPYPEKHTALHLVMAPVRHIGTDELPGSEGFTAIGKLFAWAGDRYPNRMGLDGGGFFMRFGDPMYNAGTILHLHAHIMVPDLKGEVRLPLAKEPDRDARGFARLEVFEKLRAGASEADLTPEERELMT
jgi:hypothetical protein